MNTGNTYKREHKKKKWFKTLCARGSHSQSRKGLEKDTYGSKSAQGLHLLSLIRITVGENTCHKRGSMSVIILRSANGI